MKTVLVKLGKRMLGRGQFILSKVLVMPCYFSVTPTGNMTIIGESPLQWRVVSPTTFRTVQFWDGKNCSFVYTAGPTKWVEVKVAGMLTWSCLHATCV